ncbi:MULTISPECIES: hypothetical protein [Caloramator]|uniref:Uncharacterized protein n=1 Tax=Caloramator proteoclasticus DSM 10124 TaxID=1121262 RepID=A0A1M4XDR9_9CLOT|nr:MULTISPECIES: hypothetical protein [Caloramator]SHE91595.1 hypothetical protein SAMN02746091_01389 [Caloramator proteoclasticus DSM 10124]
MNLVQSKIIKSRYNKSHLIIDKKIPFEGGVKIKNLISHNETVKVKSVKRNTKYFDIELFIECILTLEVLSDNILEKYTLTYNFENNVKVFKEYFEPSVAFLDFIELDYVIKLKKVNFKYDINIDYDTLSILGECFIVINLLVERCLMLKEINEMQAYLQVAAGLDDMDIKDVIGNLDNIVKTLSNRLNEIEEENHFLKREIERHKAEIGVLNSELQNEKIKNMNLSLECTRLTERIKDLEEKLDKERKKCSLLEIENARALDEIKRLKKERTEITSELQREKIGLGKKIVEFLKK